MTDPSGNQERRHEPRVEGLQLVHVSTFDEEGFRADLATGRTLNISAGGMRLELLHPVPLRSILGISLVLGEKIVEVKGLVVYLEAIDQERSAMGIQFLDLDAETQNALLEYLASNLS